MRRRQLVLLPLFAALAGALGFVAPVAAAESAGSADATKFTFNGSGYAYRWGKDTQYEFLRPNDSDLAKWKDLVTINLHANVTTGEELAEVANKVLANYQGAGKVIRTDSRPRTANRPAEHLIVAVFGTPELVEATFARLMLIDGAGVIAVYSHRIYGQDVGGAMGDWFKVHGLRVEKALMAWDRVPAPAALKKLPPRN